MINVNEVRLIGRLGADPELIEYGDGEKKLLKLSVGTNDFSKKVNWHNVVVFGEKQMEFINEYAKKGSSLYVEGELTYKVKDGVKYASVLTTQFHNIILLDGKNPDTTEDIIDVPF